MSVDQQQCSPWKDGYYKMNSLSTVIFKVTGEHIKAEQLNGELDEAMASGTWTFGEFEEAKREIKDYSGKTNYNVDIVMWNNTWKTKGMVNAEGTKITVWTFLNSMDHFEHITDEEAMALKDFGDPVSAPSSHYKIQPEFDNGRFIWLTGGPGLGKSTTAQMLSKTAGFVYYEADAFGRHVNPYIPPDVEGEISYATTKQKPLKGVPQERIDAVSNAMKDFMKMIQGEEYDPKIIEKYYTELCKDIKNEKNRLGGDWVVAQAVMTRSLRDHIKEELGPDLTFVVLNMTMDDQKKRLLSRQGGEVHSFFDMLEKSMRHFEPAQPDEKNAIDVLITDDMTENDVMEKVLSMLQ